jgi:hypothetical protein
VFSRAEAVAASIVSFFATAILSAYLFDTIGLELHPAAVLAVSLVAAGAIAARMRTFAGDESLESFIAFVAVVTATLGWLLWLAWPELLPIGGGSDLTHHLLLADYIDRTGRLVHDRALTPYLGEMIDYTPGVHLLAVLAGRWTRTDGLHAIYPIVAISVALKTGVIFLVALRCLPREDETARVPFALVAVVLVFAPSRYSLGSFTHDSFLAQVAAELFAVMMWWALVCGDEERRPIASAIAGLAGAATFLTWPVWTGPLFVTLATLVAVRRERLLVARLTHAGIALLPAAGVAAMYALRHVGAATIAGAPGFAPSATPAAIGWLFLGAGMVGTVLAVGDRRAQTIPLLLVAIALQAGALVMVARASGAETPYLALKMVYLAVYPLAVAGAYAVALASRAVFRGRSAEASPYDTKKAYGTRASADVQNVARGFSRAAAIAWTVVLLLAILVGRPLVATPRPTPPISNALLDAGRWARSHAPPACVDYLVGDDDSAYWLHLVVLGNPRATPRSLAKDTFEPDKAVVRWILPGGLPYAIADHVDALPRDIRDNVDVLARFGGAAVVKRRGPASCQ